MNVNEMRELQRQFYGLTDDGSAVALEGNVKGMLLA
jgi:hypothetical protein